MKAYRDTLLFLEQEGVSESHGQEHPTGAESASSNGNNPVAFGKAQVGDLVEIEIGGVVIPPTPVRARALSADQQWVFVDGSETGIEMENVTILERPQGQPETKMPPVLPLANDPEPQQTPAGYRSETFDADEGEIRITWPANLSLQSVEDMKDWLELLKRRIERRARESGEGAVRRSADKRPSSRA